MPSSDEQGGSARERLLHALLESSQYGLMLLDERLRVAWISNAGAAALRYDAASLIGRRSADFLDPSQSPEVLDAISDVLAGSTDGLAGSTEEAPGWQLGVRVRLVCGDGRPRDFEFGGRAINEDGRAELMLVFLDVSERARLEDVLTSVMERDLAGALQRFLQLASSQLQMSVGIVLHPTLGGATYASQGAPATLLDDLASERADATVSSITSSIGTLFGWLVVDQPELTPWGLETVERLVSLLVLVLSNQATFSDLVDAAATDPLTGLSNRRVLDGAIVAAEATALLGWALLYCDLDRFKAINDDWGHDAGDVVLRIVSERLRTVVRSADTIARIGGDEFVILAQADRDQANHLVRRLRDRIAETIVDARGRFEVGVSVGVATASTPDAVRNMLARGDADMRRDKAARRALR